MSVGTWTRTTGRENLTSSGNATLVSVPAGKTLLRIHMGMDVQSRYWTPDDPNKSSELWVGAGVYSVLATGGTILYPLSNPGDTAPPDQRWLYWRVLTLWPMPAGIPGQGGYQQWGTSYVPWDIDIRAPVQASSATLDINLAWETSADVPSGGATFLVWWASCLVT